MSFFDTLKQKGQEVRQKLTSEVSRFRNREFMEACVSGCALVAAADGTISSEEKQKMMGYIKNSDELKVFNADEVIAVFNKVASGLEFDHMIGKAEALKKIAVLRKKPDAARLMVRVCCVIGCADGTFDDNEKKIVREICAELDVPAADFDL